MKTIEKASKVFVALFLGTILFTGCGKEESNDDEENPEQNSVPNDISVLASKFYSDNVRVTVNENTITIASTNQPDHFSMYYPSSHELYEPYDEPENSDFRKNPNEIIAQNFVFTIPRFPEEAERKSATSFGPIGVAVNSVVFFNQNAAPGDDILDELNTFDQYEGHPQQQGQYHYHNEPIWLTEDKIGEDSFLGFLLDGFPVYGPVENGERVTNDDLDDYHGHFGPTPEFPDGIYHYHITDDLPWINGDGYYGVAGSYTE